MLYIFETGKESASSSMDAWEVLIETKSILCEENLAGNPRQDIK